MFNFLRKKPDFNEMLFNIELPLKSYKIGDMVPMDKKGKWQSYYKIVKIKGIPWGEKGNKKYTLQFSHMKREK